MGRHGIRLMLATAFSAVGLKPPSVGTPYHSQFPGAAELRESAWQQDANLVYVAAPRRQISDIHTGLQGGYEALMEDVRGVVRRDPNSYGIQSHDSWIGKHMGGLYLFPLDGIVLANARQQLALPPMESGAL